MDLYQIFPGELFKCFYHTTWFHVSLLTLRLRVLKITVRKHFTVLCLDAWPLNESEAGVDLVLIQTSLCLS